MTGPTKAAIQVVGQIFSGPGNSRAAGRHRGDVDLGEVIGYLMIAATVIASVCLIVYFVSRLRHRWRYNSHRSLFNGLCRVHGLNRNARKLLKRVARHHKLGQPGRLFLEPKWLDPAGLRGSMREQAGNVAALRNRLFAITNT